MYKGDQNILIYFMKTTLFSPQIYTIQLTFRKKNKQYLSFVNVHFITLLKYILRSTYLLFTHIHKHFYSTVRFVWPLRALALNKCAGNI